MAAASAFNPSVASPAATAIFHTAVDPRSSFWAVEAIRRPLHPPCSEARPPRDTAPIQTLLDVDCHPPPPAGTGRRHACFSALTTLSLVLSGMGGCRLPARAAILEADDDEELLERTKRDRKRRLERQGVIGSSGKETGYLQELIYKLSKVGQAIENNNLSAASSVLGPNANADWVQNVNIAFTKLSSSPQEKIEIDAFNSSLVSLISSVGNNDAESSKLAFVSSAIALEKWITLTGLVGQLKGL